MHLLLAQKGMISDGDEAIDLGQAPGDIVFLSAADTENSSIANACATHAELGWRLASLSQLTHPMSVDTYAENTVKHAKLIVIRALGGAGYFSYALDAFFATASQQNIKIVVVPGDDKPDPELERFCNIGDADRTALWQYLIEGGGKNATSFVQYCEALLQDNTKPVSAVPLLRAALYWPHENEPTLDGLRSSWIDDAPIVGICFYRALIQSGQTAPIDALIEKMQAAGLNPLPIYVSSLKDEFSQSVVLNLFAQASPSVVINATGFAVSKPGNDYASTVLERNGAPVLQAVLAGGHFDAWQASSQGLGSKDLAMNVALPEVDGRVFAQVISFKTADHYDENVQANIVRHQPHEYGIQHVVDLAKSWARLSQCEPREKCVALILANYPNQDGRIGNGVGLDTPASIIEVLDGMKKRGFDVGKYPKSSLELMDTLREGKTNSTKVNQHVQISLELDEYIRHFNHLPISVRKEIQEKWGDPSDDPFFNDGKLELPLTRFGNTFIGVQPARGYNIDPKESYHSPDLVPPHGYLAFYIYLREIAKIHAVVHMGKHGNLEWLPGKALALSDCCYPAAILKAVPHIYPFIVNDPGEGTQAKRRSSAVIIDHLTPPLTRAESYGPLKDLEALVDEYYLASGYDPRRLKLLRKTIFDLMHDTDIAKDAGVENDGDEDLALEKLDAWLCEMKEMQIRDGLHIFGVAPQDRLLEDLTVALARLPRGEGEKDQSLHRVIAKDLDLGDEFDPLDCDFSKAWDGIRPAALDHASVENWRSNGDTVERIEMLAADLVSGRKACRDEWTATKTVLQEAQHRLMQSVIDSGENEIKSLLMALDGKFVQPGPSGAPTRGRPDVLPTGKNFYSVDSRSLPTPTAWELGRKSAELLIARFVQDNGNWPTSFGITAWGTSNMRTGGDDLAQVLALMGAKPTWDMASRRMTGYEIIPLAMLGRPRVDVTLRISGFFRDAFPDQIALIDRAVRAIGDLDEDAADNPIAVRMKNDAQGLIDLGVDAFEAKKQAGYRVFGSKPGAYGAGLQALIDEKGWETKDDLAEAYMVWGSYAYGAGEEGVSERGLFETRLKSVEAVVQNQDNREHDILDSDDYYQFEGGLTAAVEKISGAKPSIYHNDHSRPEKPVIRSLDEEISRVVRARAVNPKWIAGVMRHSYKGAFEMAATLDYMFAFAATTGAVHDHHFELVYQAYLVDDDVRQFIEDNNLDALRDMARRFLEAIDRDLWQPKSNSAKFHLSELAQIDDPKLTTKLEENGAKHGG